MPYKVEKRTGQKPFKIVKSDTGKVVGSSDTKAKAQDSIRARHANEKK